MVMADIGDRGRRRRRRGGRRDFQEREMIVPVAPQKTPTILAKPASSSNDIKKSVDMVNGPEPGGYGPEPGGYGPEPGGYGPVIEKPQILLKSRTENHHHLPSNGNISPATSAPGVMGGVMGGEGAGSPVYSIQRPATAQRPPSAPDNPRVAVIDGSGQRRLTRTPEMSHSMKLVDDSFNWSEAGMEMLLDQTDFLVVGVLGLQGSGKSFILSHLAAGELEQSKISFPFYPQQRGVREVCSHQTVGIDMYVNSERTIYLDSQGLLSPSLLHQMIQHDKKYPAEFSSVENCVEIQSLEIASFMLTVCNVVLVVADWFIDTNIIRFLRTAEMLKPPTPGHDGTVVDEYFPHVVMVMNCADRDDFGVETYSSMQTVIDTMMEQSKLKYKGGINMAGCRGLAGLTKLTVQNNNNLYLLPKHEEVTQEKDGVLSLMPSYRGHPGFESLINSLRNKLLAVPRRLLTHTTLSERNWFHYAARTWDGVKKSQMFLEYNRLLP